MNELQHEPLRVDEDIELCGSAKIEINSTISHDIENIYNNLIVLLIEVLFEQH
jgi:hypothetical protein